MSTLRDILNRAPKNDVMDFLSRYGGQRVRIPTLNAFLFSERNQAILRHRREGMTYATLSARHNLSERQIRRIIQHNKAA